MPLTRYELGNKENCLNLKDNFVLLVFQKRKQELLGQSAIFQLSNTFDKMFFYHLSIMRY